MSDFFGDDSYDDDAGFENYVITTIDPGPSLLVATILFCISMYLILPCMVRTSWPCCGSSVNNGEEGNDGRRKRRRRRKWWRRRGGRNDDWARRGQQQYPDNIYHHGDDENNNEDNDEIMSPATAEATNRHHAVAAAPPAASAAADHASRASSILSGLYDGDGPVRSNNSHDDDDALSQTSSVSSFLAVQVAAVRENVDMVLDNARYHTPAKHHRTKHLMNRLDATLDETDGPIPYEYSEAFPPTTPSSPPLSSSPPSGKRKGGGGGGGNNVRSPQKEEKRIAIEAIEQDGSFLHDARDGVYHPPTTGRNNQHHHHLHHHQHNNNNNNNNNNSNNNNNNNNNHPNNNNTGTNETSNHVARYWDKLLSIVEFDKETKRLYKLGLPFFLQAFLEGACEIGRVAIIGRLIGTRELSAYVTVVLFVSFTADVLSGFAESLVSLLSHSIGMGNRVLTGQHIQNSITLYVLFSIPFMILWYFVMYDLLLIFGFPPETAMIGKIFTVPYMFYELSQGILKCVHALLDVTDMEMVSTVFVVFGEIVATMALFIAAWFWNPTLEAVGYIYVITSVVMLLSTIVVILLKGWFRRYYCGLFKTFGLKNRTAVIMMMKTSSYLSGGYLLAYGEWEILAFFAAFLGPAEVAAWGVLGTIWDALEMITESIADSAEVRVGLLLGAGKPDQAKKAAYKSVFIGFIFALVSTSCLFIAGDNLSTWLTEDPTLQLLVNQLIPLFGIGNIVLTMGTMAWTIVGAQGRYRLSTLIGVLGSWLITTPLSAIFSIALRINLQGQTAAVVIGYMVSGMVTNAVLLKSDWPKLSQKVIEMNKEYDYDASDDDSSSSSSSDSPSVAFPEEDDAAPAPQALSPSPPQTPKAEDNPNRSQLQPYGKTESPSSPAASQKRIAQDYQEYHKKEPSITEMQFL